MQSIATLCRDLCKNGLTDREAIPVMDSGGPKEACIKWDLDAPCKGAIIKGKDMLGHARRHSAVSCPKMAELIDLQFALWTWMGQRKHKFNRIRQVAPMCPHRWAHSRYPANTIEPFVCGTYFDHLFSTCRTTAVARVKTRPVNTGVQNEPRVHGLV